MDDRDKRQFEDALLEAALGERANAEPRAGLEERILSSVQARQEHRRAAVPQWAWAFAVGAVAAAVLAVFVFHHPAVSRPPAPPTTAIQNAKPAKPAIAHPLMARIPPPAANSKTVRLAVFPAPRPLSPQEKMLLAYVRKGRLAQSTAESAQALDEDLKIPKLEVAALDIKPIEGSQELPEK
jgi:hypothetical protein